MNNNLQIFVNNLKKHREIKQLSAYELSLRIGKDTSYIKQLESGRCFPSLETLLQICETLNCTPNDLLGF